MIGIFLLVVLGGGIMAGSKYMNHLINTQPTEKQIKKNNKILGAIMVITGILQLVLPGVIGVISAFVFGVTFGLILSNKIYSEE